MDQAALDYLKQADASALQIAILKDGHFVYSEAHGYADPQHRRPATTRSLFQVGSNTKKATALAVLRAVERGRLRLDASVSRALPGFDLQRTPGWAREATIRDLLSHQSGLWDFTAGYEAPEDGALHEILWGPFARHEWASTPPGAVWSYANANYGVLGAALERAYRAPYPEIMEREVYGPLGMRDSHARRADAIATRRAVWGYGSVAQPDAAPVFDPVALIADPPWLAGAEWVSPDEQTDNAFLRPAGLAWSTAEDECRLGAFLVDGARAFLSEASRTEMTSAQSAVDPGDPNLHSGFGLMVASLLGLGPEEWYGLTSWAHSGATLTMSSTFLVLPQQRLVISILRNAREPSSLVAPLVATALAQFARLPAKQSAPSAAPDDPARYAGRYVDARGLGSFTLTWDGSSLTLTAPELAARGVAVAPAVVVARPNVLLLSLAGHIFPFTVWPSGESEAGYLVGREGSLTRVTPAAQ